MCNAWASWLPSWLLPMLPLDSVLDLLPEKGNGQATPPIGLLDSWTHYGRWHLIEQLGRVMSLGKTESVETTSARIMVPID